MIFKKLHYNVYQILCHNMPEGTIGEKIAKLRSLHHMNRIELANMIKIHIDTVEKWELENIMPKPSNINKLCIIFNVKPKFFHEYYALLESDYSNQIIQWKLNHNMTYPKMGQYIGISESGLKRLVAKKMLLSFELFSILKSKNIL